MKYCKWILTALVMLMIIVGVRPSIAKPAKPVAGNAKLTKSIVCITPHQ